MDSLWPDDIDFTDDLKPPVRILHEQATALGSKSKNLVVGRVKAIEQNDGWIDAIDLEKENTPPTPSFHYAFYLAAPALGNYQYQLFSVHYDINFYPVTVSAEDEIMRDVIGGAGLTPPPGIGITARSEDDFIILLRKIFGAKKTLRLVKTLIAQSRFS